MATTTSELWQAVLGELEVSLSRANYKTWFKNTDLVEVNNGVAVVGVPNIFTREWIEKKYHDQIFAALSKLVDGLERVKYQIGSTTQPALEKEPIEAVTQVTPAVSSTRSTPKSTRHSLRERYTFENFVVGDSNRLAFAAAKLVSEKPGEHYNPLFLYGPVGVGKTHLMWAINEATLRLEPDSKTVYTPSEDFLNEFTRAIREGKTRQLTDKYRRVDLLLVDDLQFLAGKEKFQEEFFHTFNALHQAGKQIVLCSDRPPKAIPTLEDRLRSRFEWGMVADIQPPDLETRVAILQNKAISQQFELPNDIALMIAEMVETNIRELEGALTRVVAYCQLQNIPISVEVVQTVLGSTRRSSARKVSPKAVIETTAEFYNVKPTDLTGSKRDREIVLPRQVAMHIMRDELNMSFPQIAHALGGRDHTTVMHGVKKIHQMIGFNDGLNHEIKTLKAKIVTPE